MATPCRRSLARSQCKLAKPTNVRPERAKAQAANPRIGGDGVSGGPDGGRRVGTHADLVFGRGRCGSLFRPGLKRCYGPNCGRLERICTAQMAWAAPPRPFCVRAPPAGGRTGRTSRFSRCSGCSARSGPSAGSGRARPSAGLVEPLDADARGCAHLLGREHSAIRKRHDVERERHRHTPKSATPFGSARGLRGGRLSRGAGCGGFEQGAHHGKLPDRQGFSPRRLTQSPFSRCEAI